ncbi:MAG: hypothetical protein AAF802_02020 [Planctomycetota bacterium]
MKTLQVPLLAFLAVALIASVGFAEQVAESSANSSEGESSSDSSTADIDEGDSASNATESSSSGGNSSSAKRGLAELSVPPMSHKTYPETRPSWINNEPDVVGGVHRLVVATKGWDDPAKCEGELEALMPVMIENYLEETLPAEHPWLYCSPEWIDERLVSKRYKGTFQQGDQTLHEMAVELEIDRKMQRYFQRLQESEIVDDRLQGVTGTVAFGFLCLCVGGGALGFINRRLNPESSNA